MMEHFFENSSRLSAVNYLKSANFFKSLKLCGTENNSYEFAKNLHEFAKILAKFDFVKSARIMQCQNKVT